MKLNSANNIEPLANALREAEAVVIGAGAGLSTAAGFVYSGERFERYFSDFEAQYGFHDMYSGGFYPFPRPEILWAYWSRNIWVNRYMDPPGSVYNDLLRAVGGKEFFVLTTNVDHCFQKAGFAKERLFYTQGDYGLFQCSEPCSQRTWDNGTIVREMLQAQGFSIGKDGALTLPAGKAPRMEIPTELIPKCPICGRPMALNLRSDDRFVEDDGWHAAARRYSEFLTAHEQGRVLYLEIGVGFNTPGIIKYNFWQRVYQNPEATYACLNMTDPSAPKEIVDRSVSLGGDSAALIAALACKATRKE